MVSKYIELSLNGSEVITEPEDLLWSSEHIRQSQYLLQIIRYTNGIVANHDDLIIFKL